MKRERFPHYPTYERLWRDYPGGYWSHKQPQEYATSMMLHCLKHYLAGGLASFKWDAIGYASR